VAGREMGERQLFGVTVVLVGLVLVVVGVFTFLSYRKFSKLTEDIRTLNRKIEEHGRVVDKREDVENAVAAMQSRFDNVKKYLPENREIDRLLDTFANKCIEARLEMSKLEKGRATTSRRRGKAAASRDVEKIQFRGDFKGSFHSLAKFVSMVEDWEHFNRFVSITTFRVAAADKGVAFDTGAQMHSISMTLELYKYEEPTTTPAPKKPAGARQAGR
jgi:Tfp pilus assembly protein PilO